MAKKDTVGQRYVIGQFLSTWPAAWSYDKITDALVDDMRCVSVTQAFEDWPGLTLYEHMNDLANDIDKLLDIKRRGTLDEVIMKVGNMAKS